jgi:radical SAM protein with 4Fe4S-binding SPASM domain
VGELKDYFDILELRITLRCNLSCRYCFLGGSLHRSDQEVMSLGDYKKLIGGCKDKGLKEVVFTGGEPLIRFDLLQELIAFSACLGLKTKIHSNGTLISEEKCHRLAQSGLSEIRISIDSIDEFLFDRITASKGLYQKLNNNIQTLITERSLIVGGRFTITSLNYHHIPQVYHFCADRGFDYLELKPVAIVGHAAENEDLGLSKEQHIFAMKAALDLEKSRKIELRFDSPCFHFLIEDTVIPHYSCSCSSRRLSVSPSGEVTPCVYLGIESISIGNIYQTDIEDLYRSEFNQRMRFTIPEECKKCDLFEICKGGCKARIYNKYERFDRVSPECVLLTSPAWGV